jgi:UDP-N-acetylglucosamine--N-acetylmuramyl-(pentapeptide) pyrophosphoryl-undecaprenol N-acetylglucosamine transferase
MGLSDIWQRRTEDESKRVVMAGGGTGGHLFPGIAVAEALQSRDPTIDVPFVGTDRGIEARVVPDTDFEFHAMDVPPLKGGGIKRWIENGVKLPRSGFQALSLLRELGPDLVIGLGGYAAGPLTLAASVSGIATALMEQNAHPGMTNRALGSFVDCAFVAFEESCEVFDDTPCEVVGNPVRRSIRDAAEAYDYEVSEDGTVRLLITGGSGGAESLNRRLPEALCALGETAESLEVRHQYGEGRGEGLEEAYESFAGALECVEFIDDMAEAYTWCDFVICRAGATTIAEILTFGLPAIFVPSPNVTDDHQMRNAREITEAGAGLMLEDDQVGSARSTRLISGLLQNPSSLANIAAKTRQMRPDDPADAIAERLIDDLLT